MASPEEDSLPLYEYSNLEGHTLNLGDGYVRSQCRNCGGPSRICRCAAFGIHADTIVQADRRLFPSAEWDLLWNLDHFLLAFSHEQLLFDHASLHTRIGRRSSENFGWCHTTGFHSEARREEAAIREATLREEGWEPTPEQLEGYPDHSSSTTQSAPGNVPAEEHPQVPQWFVKTMPPSCPTKATSPEGTATPTRAASADLSATSTPLGGAEPMEESSVRGSPVAETPAVGAGRAAGKASSLPAGTVHKVTGPEAVDLTRSTASPIMEDESEESSFRLEGYRRGHFGYREEAAIRHLLEAAYFVDGPDRSFFTHEHAEIHGLEGKADTPAEFVYLDSQRRYIRDRLMDTKGALLAGKSDWLHRLAEKDFRYTKTPETESYMYGTLFAGDEVYTTNRVHSLFESYMAVPRLPATPLPNLYARGLMDTSVEMLDKSLLFLDRFTKNERNRQLVQVLRTYAEAAASFSRAAKECARDASEDHEHGAPRQWQTKAEWQATRRKARVATVQALSAAAVELCKLEAHLPYSWTMLTVASKPWLGGTLEYSVARALQLLQDSSPLVFDKHPLHGATWDAYASLAVCRIILRGVRVLYEEANYMSTDQATARGTQAAGKSRMATNTVKRLVKWIPLLFMVCLIGPVQAAAVRTSDTFIHETLAERTVNPELVTFSREIDTESLTGSWEDLNNYKKAFGVLCDLGSTTLHASRDRVYKLKGDTNTAAAARKVCADRHMTLLEIRSDAERDAVEEFMKTNSVVQAWVDVRYINGTNSYAWASDRQPLNFSRFDTQCGTEISTLQHTQKANFYVDRFKRNPLSLCYLDCTMMTRCHEPGTSRAVICTMDPLRNSTYKQFRSVVRRCHDTLPDLQDKQQVVRDRLAALLPAQLWHEYDTMEYEASIRVKRSTHFVWLSIINLATEAQMQTHIPKLYLDQLHEWKTSLTTITAILAHELDYVQFVHSFHDLRTTFELLTTNLLQAANTIELIGVAARNGLATESALSIPELGEARSFLRKNFNKTLTGTYEHIQMIFLRGPRKYFLMFTGPTVDTDRTYAIVRAIPFPDINDGYVIKPLWYQEFFAVSRVHKKYIPLDSAEALQCLTSVHSCFASRPREQRSRRSCGVTEYFHAKSGRECVFQKTDDTSPVILTVQNTTCYNLPAMTPRTLICHNLYGSNRVRETMVQGKECIETPPDCALRFGSGTEVWPSNTKAVADVLQAVRIGPRQLSNRAMEDILMVNSMHAIPGRVTRKVLAALPNSTIDAVSPAHMIMKYDRFLRWAAAQLNTIQLWALVIVSVVSILSLAALAYSACSIHNLKAQMQRRSYRLVPAPL